MAGILSLVPFPTYPDGFPERIIKPFEDAIGRSSLGNRAASGTEIIKELGCPIILHICGDTTNRLEYIVEAGFDCFHFDSKVRTLTVILYNSLYGVPDIHEEKKVARICKVAANGMDKPERSIHCIIDWLSSKSRKSIGD